MLLCCTITTKSCLQAVASTRMQMGDGPKHLPGINTEGVQAIKNWAMGHPNCETGSRHWTSIQTNELALGIFIVIARQPLILCLTYEVANVNPCTKPWLVVPLWILWLYSLVCLSLSLSDTLPLSAYPDKPRPIYKALTKNNNLIF